MKHGLDRALTLSLTRMDFSVQLIKSDVEMNSPNSSLICFVSRRYQPDLPHDSWSKYHKTICGL